MKTYALINYDSGEICTVTANTCKAFYDRALSERRYCINRKIHQDHLTLVVCDAIEYTSNGIIYRNAKTLQEWAGGNDTPLLEMGVSMPLYNRLHFRGIDTAGSLAEYAKGMMIFSRLPSKMIREVIEVLTPYNKLAAMTLTRHYNERHYKRGE